MAVISAFSYCFGSCKEDLRDLCLEKPGQRTSCIMSSDLALFGPPATNPVAVETSWPSLTFDQIDAEKTEIEMVLVYRQIPCECCPS